SCLLIVFSDTYISHPSTHSSPTRRSSDLVNYGSPNVENAASVQSYIKQGRLTLLRELFRSNMTDADIQARLNTVAATGMHCLALDRKSTRLNSSHQIISYAVFCLKKKHTN